MPRDGQPRLKDQVLDHWVAPRSPSSSKKREPFIPSHCLLNQTRIALSSIRPLFPYALELDPCSRSSNGRAIFRTESLLELYPLPQLTSPRTLAQA